MPPEYASTAPAPPVRTICRAALFIVACALALIAASPLASALRGPAAEIVVGSLAALWALGLTFLFVRWDRLRPVDVGVGLDRRTPLRLALGALLGLGLVALWASLLAALGVVQWTRAPEIGLGVVGLKLTAYAALACREELAFHGYPLRRLRDALGLWPAQLIIATIFALEHRLGGWTWTQTLLGAGVGSLLFGMAALATRGLAVPIGIHAAWNLGHWCLGMKGEPGLWRAVMAPGQEDRAGLTATLAYVAVFAAALIAFWLWGRGQHAQPRPLSASPSTPAPHPHP